LFIGLIFAFYERITGLKYKGLEIQTVTEKAIKDAQEIEKILDEVRIQKQTLDLILRDLDQTHSRITGIETQVLNKGKDIEKLSMDVEEQIEHLERRIKDVDTGVFAKILALR